MSENAEVLKQLGEFREDFRIFCTQILGSPDEDKPNGRLPILERASADHGRRITRIERVFLLFAGAAGLLKVLGWCADSLAHISQIFRT